MHNPVVHVSVFQGHGNITELYSLQWADVLLMLASDADTRGVHINTERLSPFTNTRTPYVHIIRCD